MQVKAKGIPLETVSYVDLKKYTGKWYEIARFDQSFQKDCTAVTAEYSLSKNGYMKVKNSCRLHSPKGKLKVAKARGWIKDKQTNAKLKVQFFLRKFKIPLFAGNYWILDLGDDYEYALIGDPSRKYLWILNREEKMDDDTYIYLVQKAKDLKFDTSKLLKTVH